MKLKKCFKCNIEWPLIFFYKHSKMKDGHLNKCKKCAKKDALDYRHNNIDKIHAYDKKRNATEKRIAHLHLNAKKWREKNPEKYKAQNMVNNYIRDGKFEKGSCCVCAKEKAHAHHEDYSRPLDVIWLCPEHHANI